MKQKKEIQQNLIINRFERRGVVGEWYCRTDTHDHIVISEILGDYPFYFPDERFEVHKGQTIIDIGGHIGVYSVYAGLSGANVITFEPCKETFNVLSKNIDLNRLQNVKIVNAGVWSTNGNGKLSTSKFATGSNSLVKNIFTDGSSQEVLLIDLNEYLNRIEKVNIMKVDCEGSEYEILYNIKRENLDKIDRIVMETHLGFGKCDELLNYLSMNGFETNYTRGDDETCKTWCIKLNI